MVARFGFSGSGLSKKVNWEKNSRSQIQKNPGQIFIKAVDPPVDPPVDVDFF